MNILLEKIMMIFVAGDTKEALELCDKVINDIEKPIPEHSQFYDLRGLINVRLKKYKEALDDYNTALKINPYDLNTYFNMSIANHEIGLYKESIWAYLQYSKLDRYFKYNYINQIISLYIWNYDSATIEDIFKILSQNEYNDLWRKDITFNLLNNIISKYLKNNENILKDIKNILLYEYFLLQVLSLYFIMIHTKNNNIEISHYTSLKVLFSLLNDSHSIRITNISNANDPKEGKILENIFSKNGINIKIRNKENLITLQTSYSRNKDALTMFRFYGKEENKEATGICLSIDRNYFNKEPLSMATPMQMMSSYKRGINNLYFILYYNEKENQLIFNPTNSKYSNVIVDLNKYCMIKLNKVIDESIENIINYIFYKIFYYAEKIDNQIEDKNLKDEIFSNLFENIRYVIKHEAFFEEQELRMLITTDYKDENIKVDNNKRLYIDYNELFNENENFIKEIILGGKIEDKELMADYIKKIIYNKYKGNNKMNEIKVSISQAPLR